MLGHLQGLFSVLDMLAEGGGRHAELFAGRDYAWALRLQPVKVASNRKIPLTQHQISRLFKTRTKSKVSIEH